VYLLSRRHQVRDSMLRSERRFLIQRKTQPYVESENVAGLDLAERLLRAEQQRAFQIVTGKAAQVIEAAKQSSISPTRIAGITV
jgi:hypothetical protein